MKEISKYSVLIDVPDIKQFLIYDIGKKIIAFLEKTITRHSLVENTAFLDPHQFPWTKKIESNWHMIREELDRILQSSDHLPSLHDISAIDRSLSYDHQWKTYFLYGYGIKMQQNCQYCPATTQLIENIPGMKTAFFRSYCLVNIFPSIEVPTREYCAITWL